MIVNARMFVRRARSQGKPTVLHRSAKLGAGDEGGLGRSVAVVRNKGEDSLRQDHGPIARLARSGEPIELRTGTGPVATEEINTLVRTRQAEVLRLLVPRGSTLPTHQAEGEIILHCLKGCISLTISGRTQDLRAEQLLYIADAKPFSIHGIDDASILMMIVAPKQGANVELIGRGRPR